MNVVWVSRMGTVVDMSKSLMSSAKDSRGTLLHPLCKNAPQRLVQENTALDQNTFTPFLQLRRYHREILQAAECPGQDCIN